MNDWPYHQYLFFDLDRKFRALSPAERRDLTTDIESWAASLTDVEIVTYSTLGFKTDTTFLIWARSHKPDMIQNALRDLLRTRMGEWLILHHSLFGIVRQTTYSNRPQKSDQVIKADERLPYLIIYPFTKTVEWHLLEFDQRKSMMKDHIMVGIKHPHIRQCLLYAYGVDDHEFVVSYETPTLEQFQDLIMELRATEARRYTQNDLPIFTGIYKPLKELIDWL
jgi:chlorite dismutase